MADCCWSPETSEAAMPSGCCLPHIRQHLSVICNGDTPAADVTPRTYAITQLPKAGAGPRPWGYLAWWRRRTAMRAGAFSWHKGSADSDTVISGSGRWRHPLLIDRAASPLLAWC
jgi:hypothetical protein